MRITGLAVLLALPGLLEAAPRTYRVDSTRSRVTIDVGKAGVFKFAGHEHKVRVGEVSGTVVADPDDLAGSSVTLTFVAGSLSVVAEGEPAGDAPKVQEIMRGPKVLDTGRYGTIELKSRKVTGHRAGDGAWSLSVTGDLTLHGTTRSVTVPLRVRLDGDLLTAEGHTELSQGAFGIEVVSAGGGTVKVKDEVGVTFTIVAAP